LNYFLPIIREKIKISLLVGFWRGQRHDFAGLFFQGLASWAGRCSQSEGCSQSRKMRSGTGIGRAIEKSGIGVHF
jgi:hypothetical protein